ncbi:B3 domain-containing protein Os07g0563300-like isoform X2 [Primulina eburnea]|uniref:B3 domain-containing protein Os07g0563300-like isoform X2 n=1 Tax=Primulina eburnea TaxID=1245227 RepID=UPI003C6C62CF
MSSSSSKNICFNSNCKEASEKWRNGWRRRTGEYAPLCDRCASAYEEGKFCEAFHSSTSGWRCCESCGKQIHCGCIVSFHMFVLLDAGGIECLTCARKSFVLTPNPAWPPPSQSLTSPFERRKGFSVKTLGSIVGSGPVPWRIAPSLFKESNIQSEAQTRMPFEIDVLGGINLFGTSERLPTASPEKKRELPDERCFNGKLIVGPFDTFQNGHNALNPKEHPFLSINNIQPIIFPIDDSSNFSLTTASSSKTEQDDTGQLSATFSTQNTISIPVDKKVGSHYRMDSCGETQVRNGKVQGDGRSRNQLLPRYRPQITEELLQISSYSKSVITPLFEKTLSASDAGRIGRLVLPKKCAEAYFPPIAQPEGLPLKVLDVKGKEWVFQFRFWPNNNSRMYVLEGITPCIQSLRLQAGDVVTFSRLEPEGNLVMGGRKSSSVPSPDQGDGAVIKGNNVLIPANCQAKNKCVEGITVNGHMKGKSPSSFQPISHVSKADIGSTTSEIHETKPIYSSKGKGSILVSKCKRLRIENDIELKLSTDEAQGLMRPPAKIVPSVFVVDGCEFEEFEGTAPIIGRPTILATDHFGEKIKWVQCEDCFKWRKVPKDVLLPSGWICSENEWDLDRSRCSDAEELAVEKLEDILPAINKVSSKIGEITTKDADMFVTQERLDTLANLATLGDDGDISASSHSRSKRPWFATEESSKHKQSCDCAICSSSKHRFRTLMERYVKHQLEEIGESASQKSQQQQFPEQVHNVDTHRVTDAGNITPTWGEMPSGSGIGNLVRTRMQQDGIGGANLISCLAADGGNQEN